MKTKQEHLFKNTWNTISVSEKFDPEKAQLVLAFGSNELVIDENTYGHLKKSYPGADIIMASTSGEITANGVYDDTISATAIQFEKTEVKVVWTNVTNHENSYDTGKHLMEQLNKENLVSVLIISDGTKINGSELVSGLNENNPGEVPITGGLAGDAARFSKTYVGINKIPTEGNVVAVGFYGNNLKIGHGSFGGWDEFGRERIITKSNKNVLYEIDDSIAIELYKEYLGPYADELPGSALLFPLSIKIEGSEKNLVRTILSLDEDQKSMTFAGNLPEGSKVRLMKANFEKLIDGSSIAAQYSLNYHKEQPPQLALLISCVGRKLILQERSFEEVEAAKEIFGEHTNITGFYSYGEISPFNPSTNCELHNQTMTITTFTELL